MRPPYSSKVSLLVVDDDPITLRIVEMLLAPLELRILTAEDAQEGLRLIREEHPQILLVDYRLPGIDGMEVIERSLEVDPDLYAMLMTAHYSTESAVAAIQRGACDYFEKPIVPERLNARMESILQELQERRTAEGLESELMDASRFEGMIGRSPEMLEVFGRIRHVAPHFRTALVTGPTGTGKELVAHAMHRHSPVAKGPFAVLNCSAVVETLFESELFGHVKGAFTGALQDKIGVFEYANRGTVFLDEIGELPLPMQAKLLRVLQQQEVQRVGSPQPRKVDVRIVAATNRDLRDMVRERQFREDLFYRLAMVEIRLPALQRRVDDIPLLLRFLMDKYASLYDRPIRKMTLRCQQLLQRYPWPGNVREMENVIGSACMMAQGSIIDINDLPEHIRESGSEGARADAESDDLALPAQNIPMHELNRLYAIEVLRRTNGNKARAAEALGIGRATLYRLLAGEKETANAEA
jgi:DNA-binding NtrC family response regulator